MSQTPLARLYASPPRRIAALAMLMVLAIMLFLLAFGPGMVLGYRIFLIIIGAAVLWTARGLHRGTQQGVDLYPSGLYLTDGTALALLDNIVGVERGTFAFKPSNGFVVKLATAPGRDWAPGLYWIVGRRLGVGGVTSRADAKFMAEALAMRLATVRRR
ncbi:MAG: hypothetical protein ACPGRD_04375 [Planktomarina sp.]